MVSTDRLRLLMGIGDVGVKCVWGIAVALLAFGSVSCDESSGASMDDSPTGRATFLLSGPRLERGRSEYLVAEFDRYDQVNFGFGILFRFR